MPFFDECVRCIVGGPASLFVRFGALVLFFPILICAIIIAARWTKGGSNRDRAVIATSILSAILLLFVPLALTSDWPKAYSPLVLHEGVFQWPPGCANREYYDGEEINIACHDYRNTLPRKLLFDHGFPGLIERTEHDYFRVGSEAINFRCNYFTEKCTVRYAKHDVFQ